MPKYFLTETLPMYLEMADIKCRAYTPQLLDKQERMTNLK